MNTPELINRLSRELTPPPRHFFKALWGKWFFGSLIVAALTLAILPIRYDLAEHAAQGNYLFKTALWLVTSFVAVGVVYKSSVPGLIQRKHVLAGVMFLGLLALIVLGEFSFAGLAHEFRGEMDFHRGRCGPIISIVGFVQAVLLVFLSRRAAPTQPWVTGGWIGISAGCYAAFLVQFVCAWENPLHLLLWHFLPIFLLAAFGLISARRLLRW